MPARKRSKLHKKTLPQLREPARVRLRRKFHIRSLDELKRDAVKRVLKVTGGRSRLAAKLLCVGVTSIYRWQQEFGIPSLYTGPYRRFGRVQRVRTAPQLRRKTGIKTLREQREDQIARVLRLTRGHAHLTAALLAIGRRLVYRHIYSSQTRQSRKQASRRLRKRFGKRR